MYVREVSKLGRSHLQAKTCVVHRVPNGMAQKKTPPQTLKPYTKTHKPYKKDCPAEDQKSVACRTSGNNPVLVLVEKISAAALCRLWLWALKEEAKQ